MKKSIERVRMMRLVASAGRAGPLVAGAVAAAMLGMWAPPVLANGIQGAKVVHGQASIEHRGSTTTIRAGHNSIINYQSFNIGAGETVRFVQPGSSSRVLNRVTGADPTQISGSLMANGIVYITNPAGVFFTQGALVNVGEIYAAAGSISNADFLANVNRFTNLTGKVENHGTINARAAHLLGLQVANFGTISAPDGLVTMTAGKDVYLGEEHGHFFVRVSGGNAATEQPAVSNSGEIAAPRGRVSMRAGDMYAMALEHSGRTRARDITLEGGDKGVVSVSGELDASGTGLREKGGTVHVLGEKVQLSGATIDASGPAGGGTVLVGGDYQGKGEVRNAELTAVSRDSTIRADATNRGDGGRVIVWGEDWTGFYGSISARGGARGGEWGVH